MQLELGKVLIGETVPEILDCDLRLGEEKIPQLREAITHCENVRDFVTRDLFAAILADEEGHVDFLESHLELIVKIGRKNYGELRSGDSYLHRGLGI